MKSFHKKKLNSFHKRIRNKQAICGIHSLKFLNSFYNRDAPLKPEKGLCINQKKILRLDFL